MATYRRNKSGGSQSEGASNSASPASSVALSNPSSAQGINNNAPKFGTLVPNRIFVGGISSSTTEAELCHLFSKYGSVKATKIIADRAGVSKGYGFVTFDTEEEVKSLIQDAHNIILKERRLNIAPAIKKQPSSRPFDTSSPPPTAPNLYFHNGVPYTFHNGMAFFTPTAHQPTLAPLPPSADPSMYQTYGPAQNAAPAPYGTPVLVPAPPPMYMPQNYSYQPMPMTNGAAPQFIYAGSASSNSSSSSPMAATPDTPHPHLPPPLPPPQFYAHQYPTQEAYFHPPVYISYYNSGDFEAQEQQTTNDMMQQTQHYERQYAAVDRPVVVANTTTAPRWSSNPPINCHQIKRLVCNKRQNGSAPNTGVCGNGGGVRLTKKSQGTTDVENDLGGGGDAQPLLQLNLTPPSSPSTTGNNPEVTSKMQSLSLGNSS
ncbi:deleted in azoospermia-like isoform X3 [Homalodisca vitripennis]|uniref:deleted in azoospermia-like isoform X3 n=1 Tax=Homalodisca vitripennis TaxID=197043 RepID=UPI001EEAFB12|nr:deleted in azoospermia-like isoform X3 [Homalodisca vitripennis]